MQLPSAAALFVLTPTQLSVPAANECLERCGLGIFVYLASESPEICRVCSVVVDARMIRGLCVDLADV